MDLWIGKLLDNFVALRAPESEAGTGEVREAAQAVVLCYADVVLVDLIK